MTSLEEIADAKVQAFVTRKLDGLKPTIVAIQQEMNGRGLPISAMTVKKICDECISLFDKIRDDMKKEYAAVLDNVFWPTESLGSRLISKVDSHFGSVADRTQGEIKDATQSLLNSNIHKQLCKDVEEAQNRALTDLSLFIDSHCKILVRKKIVRMIFYIPKLVLTLVKKLFFPLF